MQRLWTWVKRIGGTIYVLVAGLFGSGGHVIVDRGEMYGEDPRNDPYSTEFGTARTRNRDR